MTNKTPSQNGLIDNQGWDAYWGEKKQKGSMLYDVIAEFYRKFIIRPLLNHFIKKYMKPGEEVLHAGCGSGQVDQDIRSYVKITGMDISVNALKVFDYEAKGMAKSLHGSIFQIPLADSSVDGIYNLGVMEHFTMEEIEKILSEFKRVVKNSGKLVILWPPEFGLSVMFFKVLKVIITTLTGKKDVKFHPDEISRIQSKQQAYEIFEKAGFRVIEYYFGPRDVFTYSVIVAEKK